MARSALSNPALPSARSLWPREHGAFFELALPLAVTHWLGRPSVAGWLFTASALAGFFAHEPLLVLLGHRGPRVHSQQGALAERWLAAWSLLGFGSGLGAILSAPPWVRATAALPAVLALVVAAQIARKAERTLSSEVLVCAALAAVSVPVGAASGIGLSRALSIWAVWSVGTTAATWSVHAIIQAKKQRLGCLPRVLPLLGLATLWPVARWLGWLPVREFLAALPLLVASLVLAGWAPHPRHLRRTGWLLVVASLATGLILVAAS